MIRLTTTFLVAFLAVGELVFAQADAEMETKIKNFILTQYPDAEFKRFEKKKWGDYMTSFRTEQSQWGKASAAADFSKTGEWIKTMYWVQKKFPEELTAKLKKEGIQEVKKGSFTERPDGKNYYKVQDISDKVLLFDENYKVLKQGPLSEGLVISEKIRKDLEERFESPYIIEGKMYQGLMQLDIVYRLDNSYYQDGRVVYRDEEWYSTQAYMREYVKLPLELIIFVDERGGMENFSWIMQRFSPTESYYELWFNDGTTLMLDEGLNDLSKN
ncbi:hypothetical protein [Reichenbachiella versicolor]|uniref:hypothetical protein n=1 Tax=Reichenbachiella versicolor TaxID=1821036 RepID=UPI000D6DE985|nr:hypothetical protein [Reichenbachiella versicolor]